jgi:hypothetical protein
MIGASARRPERVIADTAQFSGLEGESLAQSIVSGALCGHFREEYEPAIRAELDSGGAA